MQSPTSAAIRGLSFVIFLLFLSTTLIAQVKIHEKIEIGPKSVRLNTTDATPQALLVKTPAGPWPGSADGIMTTMQGVRVTVNAVLTVSNVPKACGYEFYVGPELSRRYFNECDGSIVDEGTGTTSFTQTISCYVVNWGILHTREQCGMCPYCVGDWGGVGNYPASVEVSGNNATVTYSFTIWGINESNKIVYGTVTAVYTITAELDAEYDLARLDLAQQGQVFGCSNLGTCVNITGYDGADRRYNPCHEYNMDATATITGGPYVYFATATGATSPGLSKTINFQMQRGYGVLYLEIDTSKGFIPVGGESVQVTVQAKGITGTCDVYLSCDYPPPTVSITYPSADSTVFLVSERHQPVITFEETHTPGNGKYEPGISWSPSKAIDTKEYFDKIQNSPLALTNEVTATNIAGKATDKRVIVLKKGEDVDHFNVTVTPDTMYSNDHARLKAIAIDKYGNEASLDDNTIMSISIDPDGKIFYWDDSYNEVHYGEIKEGNVYLAISGNITAPIQEFSITVSGDGASGTGKLVVMRASCIVLSVSSAKIQPGEKVTITIKQLDSYGNLTLYPPDQMFNLRMNTDEQYGTLRCTSNGNTGSYISGRQPFEFIAASTIDVDSTVVEIGASLWTGGGGADGIGKGKETLHISESIMANHQTKAKNIGAISNDGTRKEIELSINNIQAQLNKLSAKKGDERQKQKLAINLEQLKGQLAYEKAKTPAEKQKSLANLKQIAIFDAETAECKPTASITIKKEGCIGVKFATSKISVRDTTTLQFVYTETNQPVPTDKLLDVSIPIGDGSSGYLLPSSGVPNVTLNGFIQPIQYIAPDSIQGDSLLVYIRAVASDAGGTGGDASASLKGASLSKATEKIANVVLKSIKGPKGKIIQPQPLSRAMINAIQTLACLDKEAGAIMDPTFPTCIDQTSLSEIREQKEIVRDPDQDAGQTFCLHDDLNEHPTYIKPVICENVSTKCYGLMIPNIYAYKVIRIGTKPTSAVEVNSLSEVQDKSKALIVVNGFTKQIERINDILAILETFPSPVSDGSIPINMNDVWSYNGILAHEKTHIKQFESMVFEPTLKLVKEKFMPEYRPKSEFKGMSREDIENKFDASVFKLAISFEDVYKDILDKTYNDREFKAHSEHFKFLKSLTKEIANKYGIPYNPPPIYIPE